MIEDPLEDYETTKEYIKEKFEENPDLTESDTKLFIDVLEDAIGIEIPVDIDKIPNVGTVTRVSRDLRRNEGYEDVADDEVTEARDKKEEEMRKVSGDKTGVIFEDGEIVE